MRSGNGKIFIAAPVYQTNASEPLDGTWIKRISADGSIAGSSSAGAMKLQMSNENTPLNWSDVANTSQSYSGASAILMPLTEVCARWLRFLTTQTVAGVQTITTVADDSGTYQVDDVTCIDDTAIPGLPEITHVQTLGDTAGSLNNTYFFINSANNTNQYYVWFNVSGGGTDPMVAAHTGIEVDISTGDNAATVAAAIITFVTLATGDFTFVGSATNLVIFTNTANGYSSDAVDSSVPTGFTITSPQHGTSDSGTLNNTFFFLYPTGSPTVYYVWFNVNGTGTDPMVPGAVGIMVPIAPGEIAANIATIATGPISAVGSSLIFNANGSSADILIHHLSVGPATPVAEGTVPTGFTFSTAVPGTDPGLELAGKYFYIFDGANSPFVVWFYNTTTSQGVDPMIPNTTSVEVDFASNDTANTIADLTAAALDGLAEFAAPNPGANVITVTNAAAGSFTPAYDVNTTFTFAIVNLTGFIDANYHVQMAQPGEE